MNEWNIQSRAHACEACAQPFADKQPYHTLLLELAPELRRSDICETVLRQLVEQNDPRYAPAAYILAVMLERKRLLKVKEQLTRDGKRIFIYEQPKTGDIFAIADPELHLDQLEQVQHDVAQLLEHGLNPPAPANETPAPTAETTAVADGESVIAEK